MVISVDLPDSVETAIATISAHRLSPRNEETDPGIAIPGTVVQFWDRDPPGEVQILLEENRKRCEELGMSWMLFDSSAARSWIAATFEVELLEAFERCPHPAMQADLFRLCHLYHRGGIYLDADYLLNPAAEELLGRGAAIFVQRVGFPVESLESGFLIAPPGMDLYRRFVMAAVSNLRSAEASPEGIDLGRTIGTTGPGMMTLELGHYLLEADSRSQAFGPIQVLSRTSSWRYLSTGEGWLGHPLAYKSDARHWPIAGYLATCDRLRSAIAQEPDRAELYAQLSQSLAALQRLPEAIEAARKAVTLDHGAGFQQQLIRLLVRARDWRQAEKHARLLVGGYPKESLAHSLLGQSLRGLTRTREAAAVLNKAVALDPDNAEAHHQLGLVLGELGQWPEAAAAQRIAISLNPSLAAAHRCLARSLEKLGDRAGARVAAHQAVALRPDIPEFKLFLARLQD